MCVSLYLLTGTSVWTLNLARLLLLVAFKVYDMDRDGYISNGELFLVLKMMVGNNLKDGQLQQIVDKTIMEADKDGDGKLSFDEFVQMVSNTVRVLASFFTVRHVGRD